MAYKDTLAGLDHGDRKAVIIGGPRTDTPEALPPAHGRFMASLGGRYETTCDMGTSVADVDVVARVPLERWGSGRPARRPRPSARSATGSPND